MKILPILLLGTMATAGDISLEAFVFGHSYHTTRDDRWNENNWGLAVGVVDQVSDHWDIQVVGGTYLDSFDDRATFLLMGPSYVLGDRHGWHGTAGIAGGYFGGSGFSGAGILPTVTVGYDRVDLCFTGIPHWAFADQIEHDGQFYPDTNMIAVFLKFRVWDF